MSFRQGDVLVVPTENIPESVEIVAPENGRLIVARGEATGHHHSFPHNRGATLFRDDSHGGSMFVTTTETVLLEHQEHTALPLLPGKYKIVIQRIFQSGTIKTVLD